MVCRDDKLRDNVLDDLKKTFTTVASYKMEEDVNEIIYCQNVQHDSVKWTDKMEKSVQNINELLSNEQSLIDVEDFISELKLND